MRIKHQERGRRWPTMLLLTIGLIGGAWFAGAGVQPDRVVAADAAPSYELFDFAIEYPYVDPRDQYAEDPVVRADLAGVSYASRWAGSSYPGMAKCEIILRGVTDQVVGRVEFEVSAGLPETPPTDSWPQIEVSAPPQAATGSCANSVYPTGSGYAFDRPEISRVATEDSSASSPSKTRLAFKSRWTTTTDPALRTCSVIVRLNDGSSQTYGPLNVQLPQGEALVIEPSIAEPESIQDAEVRCSELVDS